MKRSGERGFSLIELCIALVVIGLLVAAAAQVYAIYEEKQIVVKTKDNIQIATAAIQAFQTKNGYYPCPASGTDITGTASNCAGTAGAGLERAKTPTGQWIRIGVLPISAPDKDGKPVQIVRGEQLIDGYRSRLSYAVVETMATTPAAFSANPDGSIVIKDSNDSSKKITETANYIVFSAGSDKAGAYNTSGKMTNVCHTSAVDGENCDGDAVFSDNHIGARSLKGGNDNFDDFVGAQTGGVAILKPSTGSCPTGEIIETINFENNTVTCIQNPGSFEAVRIDAKLDDTGGMPAPEARCAYLWGNQNISCTCSTPTYDDGECTVSCRNGKIQRMTQTSSSRTVMAGGGGDHGNAPDRTYTVYTALFGCQPSTDGGTTNATFDYFDRN